jgi:hypothetical protein
LPDPLTTLNFYFFGAAFLGALALGFTFPKTYSSSNSSSSNSEYLLLGDTT